MSGYNIIEKWGLPREYCSCPGCGQIYGHHNTKVCISCQECSKCCPCNQEEKNFVSADEFMKKYGEE